MNTRELIKKYNGKLNVRLDLQMIQIYKEFIHDLQQLDEPKKVVVPQFVADVIEDLREDSSELEQAFQSAKLDSYELGNIKRHARDLYESLVWLQYEAEEAGK